MSDTHDDRPHDDHVSASERGPSSERQEGPPREPAPRDRPNEAPQQAGPFSRRSFLRAAGVGSVGAIAACKTTSSRPVSTAGAKSRAASRDAVLGPAGVSVELTVNGKRRQLEVETRTTLADALREQLQLTGTKVACDRGACGSCTVQLDGDAVCACMVLAVDAHGRTVTTVEGFARGPALHPLQRAFIERDALQCGFCTPGMLMSCKTLLDHVPDPTREQVRQAVAGNLCRCGTYPHVLDATLLAARELRGKDSAQQTKKKG